MKTLLIALATVLATQAHGRGSDDFRKLFLEAQANSKILQSNHETSPPDTFTPGVMRVHITKKTFVADSNGSYHFDSKTVCETHTDIKIVDGRINPPSVLPFVTSDCDSTLNGKPLSVSVGGIVMLQNYQLFDSDGAEDLKTAGAYLVYGGSLQDSKDYVSRSSITATRDINAKSLILALEPDVICVTATGPATTQDDKKQQGFRSDEPASGGCSLNEYFSAVVEFVDTSAK